MQKNIYKYFISVFGFFIFIMSSCLDDTDLTNPKDKPDEDLFSDVPEEIKEGFSVSFKMALGPMGGDEFVITTKAESTTNAQLREIENFVDLEKLRILFFVCLEQDDNSGRSDIFLFESKSRWVSVLSDAESTTATWQVTCPVFTYGNNEDYNWDKIQDILKTLPFKVAVLANRPDYIRFSDFDDMRMEPGDGLILDENGRFSFENRGPKWGKADSDLALEDFEYAKNNGYKNIDNHRYQGKSINDLHHCQWDPVYAIKNSINKAKEGYQYYDFILKDPDATDDGVRNKNKNWMGAGSYWTHWKNKEGTNEFYNAADDKKTNYNWYFWPSKEQGIPMYGIQKFNPLENWLKGTPINISDRQTGDDGTYVRKSVHLLRSLAKVELIIPKSLGEVKYIVEKDGDHSNTTMLRYSNVFGRCEPMDVATPTEEIWASNHQDNGDMTSRCEFWNIYKYGPIINKETMTASPSTFHERMAWFYGVWKEWGWFDNENKNIPDTYFKRSDGMPSPRIYNTYIQRNNYAFLSDVLLDDNIENGEYHFVIYTGERNINDPSNFNKLEGKSAEFAFFELFLKPKGASGFNQYIIPLARHSSTQPNGFFNDNFKTPTAVVEAHKNDMATRTSQNDWNWPLVRNHVYTFRVTGVNGNTDNEGLDALVVSTEERSTPWIDFY